MRQTKSSIERQNIHPLELNDPIAYHNIDTVDLDWLEKASTPLPRNQDLPLDAFKKASGRSVYSFFLPSLVCTNLSHLCKKTGTRRSLTWMVLSNTSRSGRRQAQFDSETIRT